MLPPRILSPAERAACVSAVLRGPGSGYRDHSEHLVAAAEQYLAALYAHTDAAVNRDRGSPVLFVLVGGIVRAGVDFLGVCSRNVGAINLADPTDTHERRAISKAAAVLADVAFGPSEAPCAA